MNAWNFGNVPVEGRNSRLRLQEKVMEEMLRYCSIQDINKTAFCGDWFHTQGKVDSEVLEISNNILSSLEIHNNMDTVFLVGNHDQKDKRGMIHSLGFFDTFGEVVYRYSFRREFGFLSYTEDEEELKKFFERCVEYGTKICFIHQGVGGVAQKSGHIIKEIFTTDMIPDSVDHVFAGHYHNFKRVSDKLTIPGAPMQHTWADEGEKRGWLDVTYEDGKIDIKHIESSHPKFGVDEPFLRKDTPKEELHIPTPEPSDFDQLESLFDSFCVDGDEIKERIGRELKENKYETP